MHYRIKLHMKDTEKTIMAEEGSNLLRLLQTNGVPINTPCAGKGTCGKCAVRVAGDMEPPSDREKHLLGSEKLEKGCRLACYTHIISDADVYIEEEMREASIMTSVKLRNVPLKPAAEKHYIELKQPTLEDQRSELERIYDAIGSSAAGERSKAQARTGRDLSGYADGSGVSVRLGAWDRLEMLRDIPGTLKTSEYKITAVVTNGRLIDVEPGDTTGRLYGMAVDIGTTTVAAYLFDMTAGKCAATASMLNPQRKYGADVISRIEYSTLNGRNRAELQELIAGCINSLAERMANDAGVRTEDIYYAVFAGNTTMLHMLLGLDAAGIASAPFIPVTTGLVCIPSKELGLGLNRFAAATIFPGVSAYVGGDTVAAILSTGLYEEEGVSLLVDIGTNGEMVLGGREWMLACSTAAGPAFEGANIRNGMGGVTGAIDSVGQAPDFAYTVIGNAEPAGICGSGIVDVIAALLDAGIIDETGRLPGENEAEAGGLASDRLISADGSRAFVLYQGGTQAAQGVQTSESVSARDAAYDDGTQTSEFPSEPIVITQRDIREIQNAKAAIAAGIETLIREAGITVNDIGKVYLAGGFGSSLHVSTAVRIGLLPKELEDRVEAIGNASGAGAAEGLLSAESLGIAAELPKKVRYVELSASAYFTEKYVENMLF